MSLPHTTVAAVLLVSAQAAFAQPGDHIRAGDAVITPDIDIGMEYRTNIYRSESEPTPGANLRIAPGLTIGAKGPDHEVSFGAEWEARKFFYVGGNSTDSVSSFDRFSDFNLSGALDAFKRESVGFVLSDKMTLKNTSSDGGEPEEELDPDVESADTRRVPFTTQYRNVLTAGVRLSPGPALAITPKFRWAFDDFLGAGFTPASARRYNRRHAYGPVLAAKWAFLPRTSFVGNLSYMLTTWEEPVTAEGQNLPDSGHLKVSTGVQGRLTEKVKANAMVGYGTAFYDDPANPDLAAEVDNVSGLDGLLLTLQTTYDVTDGHKLSAGYKKDFADSFFTNYISYNILYAQYKGTVSDVTPMLRYGLRLEDYKGTVNYTSVVHQFRFDLGYEIQEWASITAGSWLQARTTPDIQHETVEYSDWNLHLLSTFTY